MKKARPWQFCAALLMMFGVWGLILRPFVPLPNTLEAVSVLFFVVGLIVAVADLLLAAFRPKK